MKISEPFLARSTRATGPVEAAYRRVACLFGLPFDVLDLDSAAAGLLAAPQGAGAILSTPNVNWVMLALDHPWLRDSVLRSRMSVVDGMLLVWLGRLAGIAFPDRVSGSDLFVRLGRAPRATRVFFFGGMADVAERASAALVPAQGALHGVGGLNPGSGDIDAMSRPELLDRVRTAGAELVVVALGALRGQAWVVRNHHTLGATWVTHLGAVVNFAAGEVSRAPAWVGRAGIEWLWRIKEEPKLWRRYAVDALRLAGLTVRRLLPLLFWQRWYAPGAHSAAARWQLAGPARARMSGSWRDRDARALHEALQSLAGPVAQAAHNGDGAQPVTLEIDLSGVEFLGPEVVGQLLVWQGSLLDAGLSLALVRPSAAARRLLHGFGADYLIRAH